MWDTRTREVLHTLTGRSQLGTRSGHYRFRLTEKILATGGDDTIPLWDVRTGALLWKLEGHVGSVEAVEFAADGNTLASWSTGGDGLAVGPQAWDDVG